MQYQTAEIEGVVIIQLWPGRVGGDDLGLPALVDRHLQTGKNRFLLRMGEIPWLNSIGIGDLAAAYSGIMRAGGRTSFCEVQARVLDAFTNIGLRNAFDIHDDPRQALEALGVQCDDFPGRWEKERAWVREPPS